MLIFYNYLVLKKCSCCKRLLDENEFNWKYKNTKRAYHCRECSRKYLRSHYSRNHEYYVKKARKRDLVIRQQSHEYIAKFLLHHPCVDCGETDILVLEFDHKERESKIDEISMVIRRGLSFDKLINEISKCDIRCANCHRRKTAKENKSWKLKYAPVA